MSMMDIPARLDRLPKHGGLPITFVTFIGPDGLPDFKVTDHHKRLQCGSDRLCGLCGEPLEYWIAFIGGPRCVNGRLWYDPPMHEDCARYAFEVCPYLAGKSGYAAYYKNEDVSWTEPAVSVQAPDRMALYITRGFKCVNNGGTMAFKADPPKRIEWKERTR